MSWFVIRSEPGSYSGQSRVIRRPLLGFFAAGKGRPFPQACTRAYIFRLRVYILADVTEFRGYHNPLIIHNM
jgi:hypothetical protein